MREIKPLYSDTIQSINKENNGTRITEPTPDALRIILEKTKHIQGDLRRIPVKDRLEVLNTLGLRWIEKNEKGHLIQLRNDLSTFTGYSEQLIDLEFQLIPNVLSAKELHENLESTIRGGTEALAEFKKLNPWEAITYLPAGPVFIISSGNSLIPPLIPTTLALASGNLVILKPSLANHLGVIEVFKELHNIDSSVGKALSKALLITYLSHDSDALDYLLSKASIRVVNFWGAEPARTTLQNKLNVNPNHPKFIVNGPLTGVAIIDEDSAGEDAARRLALNTVIYDQQLCSSPTQVIYIGTTDEAETFAKITCQSLDLIGSKVPMKSTEASMFLLQSARKVMILKGGRILSSNDASNPWTIVINKSGNSLQNAVSIYPEFSIHFRKRFLEITAVPSMEDVIGILENVPRNPAYKGIEKVQTVGTEVTQENLKKALNLLPLSGVYRIVPLQDMYMRSSSEPYDGLSMVEAFTYKVYHRSQPLPGATPF